MGRKLRGLVGVLKDTASLSKAAAAAAAAAPSSAVNLAVLRATTHHPSTEPPHARLIEALLSFGHGSRLSAAGLAEALAVRLRSTRDPAVALKSLLALHHLLTRGAFILRDQLPAVLLHHPGSGRNPLALASFPHGSSPATWALAAWIRWYARLLELLLSASVILATFPSRHHRPLAKSDADADRITSLLNQDVISELDPLVGVMEEMGRAPEMAAAVKGNKLIEEVVTLVEEDRIAAEHEILIRVRELRQRVSSFGFADSVELVCLLRRLEECRSPPVDFKPTTDSWFWDDVREMMDRVEEIVVRKEKEERRSVSRDKVSGSARFTCRASASSSQKVQFGSSRWSDR